jgi:hypothetical protein
MVRFWSRMKYETYAEYDPRVVIQTRQAFLTVWAGLGSYHDDLVLLGGLVPHYICRHPASQLGLPRPATLDVDFGVALGPRRDSTAASRVTFVLRAPSRG